MTDLTQFLANAARVPFARGSSDCCTLVADWVKLRRGVDPAEGLRDYDTDFGAARVVARAGGFLKMASDAMARCGLVRAEDALLGDVALVHSGPLYVSMAVRAQRGWACKEKNGLVIAKFEPIMIWRV